MTPTMWHAGVPEKAWDTTSVQLKAHFLQSQAWAQFQIRLGKQAFYAFGDGWSWIAFLERGKFGQRLYCPYGPTAISIESLQMAFTALLSCAKAHQVSYIRVEPQGPWHSMDLQHFKLKPAHRNIQPRFTLRQSLTGDEQSLLGDMTATNRNLYRTATKKGITFKKSQEVTDMPFLLTLLKAMATRNHIVIHSSEYFTTMANILFANQAAWLFIAAIHDQPAAASLAFDSPSTRYYAHAATSDEFRKLHPGSPLVTTMLLDAQKTGLHYFDFNGVAPPNAPNNHPWAGLTRFKQSFGGEIVDLGGTWELPVKKLSHLLYRSLAKLGR